MLKKIVPALAVATILLPVGNASAVDTIPVDSVESYSNAIEQIHNTSNGEFVISLDSDITIGSGDTIKNSHTFDNGNTVTIVGNGHTISFASDTSKINVSGATLNLGRAGQNDVLYIKGAGPSGNSGLSLVSVRNNATLNMYAKTELSDNYHGHGGLVGGGVAVYNNGIFNMYGGSIHDNAAQTWGGAVALDNTTNAQFHMYDGELYNNTAEDYMGSAVVVSGTGSVVDIQGGTIRNNSSYYGGAITSYYGDVTININNATLKNNHGVLTAGAIINWAGTTTISNSIVEGNTTDGDCAAVYSEDASMTSSNTIYRNNTAAGDGGAICVVSNSFTSSNDKIYNNSAKNGGGVIIYAGTADFSTTEVYNNHASEGANDYLIDAGITSAKIIPAANMTGYATFGSIETNLLNWYSDGSDRFDVNNPTAIVNPASIASGTQYALTAAGNVVYTLKFNTAGGSAVDDMKIVVGETAPIPAEPTKSGYTLEGWFTDDTYATEFDFTAPVTANATVYAKWSKVPEPAPDSDPTPEEITPEEIPENPATDDNLDAYARLLCAGIIGLFFTIFIIRKTTSKGE